MTKLKKSITGNYNASDVDTYVNILRKEYELSLKEQRARIIDLRDENRSLKSDLQSLQDKESDLSSALVDAQRYKKQLVHEATEKAAHIERQMKDKCDYYQKKLESLKYNIFAVEDNAISVLQSVIIEISKMRDTDTMQNLPFTLNSDVEMILNIKKTGE